MEHTIETLKAYGYDLIMQRDTATAQLSLLNAELAKKYAEEEKKVDKKSTK